MEHALSFAGEVREGGVTLDRVYNLESDTSQFNSKLKELVAVEVQLAEGILDLEKHSTVTFKINSEIFDSPKGRKNKNLREDLALPVEGRMLV